MTCIAGLKHKNKIHMGADRLASSSRECFSIPDSKIIKQEYDSGEWMFGVCGSFRAIELLRYELHLPEHKASQTPRHYMATTFIKSLRKCFKDNGLIEIENNNESFYGDFLVAHKGLLYCVEGDFSLIGSSMEYMTTGSGWQVASGSLHATGNTTGYRDEPKKRLKLALKASSDHVPSVGPPFDFEVLDA